MGPITIYHRAVKRSTLVALIFGMSIAIGHGVHGRAQASPAQNSVSPGKIDIPPPHLAEEKIYSVAKGIRPPQPLQDPGPNLSNLPKAKLRGQVILQVVIGTDGKVHDIFVQQGLGREINQRVIDAVADWQFQPAIREKTGEAVAVRIPVNVSLRNE